MRINKLKIVVVFIAFQLLNSNFMGMAQNSNELFKELLNGSDNYEKAQIYIKVGDNLKYAYPDSAISFYKKSLDISTKIKSQSAKADALNAIGIVYSYKRNNDSATIFINRALKIQKEINNTQGIVQALNNLGYVFMQLEDNEQARTTLYSALRICEANHDSVLISAVYNNLGLLFKRKHDYDSALFYYHESLKIKEEYADYNGIGQTASNIALIYKSISEFELALKYLNQAYRIHIQANNIFDEAMVLQHFGLVYESQGELKLAIRNYQKALDIMLEFDNPSQIALLYNYLGSAHIKQKEFKKGYEYLQKGIEINKDIDNVRGQIQGTLALAQFYEALKIYQNAIGEYKNALYLSESIDDIAVRSEIFEGLYNSYENFARYDSALMYYKIYAHLNDSIFNTYSRRNIEKLEIEYQSLKKEKENQDLIRQNQIKEENLKRLLLVGAILIIVLASILIFGFFFIQSKQKLEKTYQLVVDQRNDIKKQSDELKEAYKKLQEFSTFKEELTNMIVHDLKNPLNIILNVSKINNFPDKDLVVQQSGRQMMNMVMNILDVYKYEGKKFMLDRQPQYLNPLIDRVINDMGFLLSENSIRIRTLIDYDFFINIDETAFERIIVNMLTNAIKFSPQGSEIQIKTEAQKNNKLRLHIIDKGEGIAPENIEQIFLKFEQRENRKLGYSGSTGIGLTYCRMAIEAHGGLIEVKSELGKGADFYIELDYMETKVSELPDIEHKENYLLLSKENRKTLHPYILELQEKDIYEVTEIRNTLKNISKANKELQQFCALIENSVLNCNQIMYDELLELALNKV